MSGNNPSQFIIYQSEDGQTKLDVRFVDETVWLTQALLGELFSTSKQNIGQHLKNIFIEQELEEGSVVKDFFTTASDGKQYRTKHYNLDASQADQHLEELSKTAEQITAQNKAKKAKKTHD